MPGGEIMRQENVELDKVNKEIIDNKVRIKKMLDKYFSGDIEKFKEMKRVISKIESFKVDAECLENEKDLLEKRIRD